MYQPEAIPKTKWLEPYFKIAEQTAKESGCVRAQFGCVIASWYPSIDYIARTNFAVAKCCKGICQRTRLNLRHVQRVEVGAEIHAETAALIASGPINDMGRAYIVLHGEVNGRILYGTEAYPCHTCAINIYAAGFKWIYLRSDEETITPYSISEILEYREQEWEPDI